MLIRGERLIQLHGNAQHCKITNSLITSTIFVGVTKNATKIYKFSRNSVVELFSDFWSNTLEEYSLVDQSVHESLI